VRGEPAGRRPGRAQDRLNSVIGSLAAKTLSELQTFWFEMGEIEPAPAIPEILLRRLVAQRFQERHLGGLPERAIGGLGRIAKGRRRSSGAAQVFPGTTLIREWNGLTISVEVRADGYLWKDELYRSLSEIARKVTGAQWSGPRFFGLTRPGRTNNG
jgi:hypothetical protein